MAEDARKSRIQGIDRTEMTPVQNRIQDRVDVWQGRGATPFKIWMHCPEAAAGMEIIASHFKTSDAAALSHAEQELVILSTAVFWGADYAIGNHVRHARSAGLDAAELDRIVARAPASFAEPRQAAVYEMATAALAGGAVSDEAFARIEGTLGRKGIAEVLILIGFYTSISLGLKMHGA